MAISWEKLRKVASALAKKQGERKLLLAHPTRVWTRKWQTWLTEKQIEEAIAKEELYQAQEAYWRLFAADTAAKARAAQAKEDSAQVADYLYYQANPGARQ